VTSFKWTSPNSPCTRHAKRTRVKDSVRRLMFAFIRSQSSKHRVADRHRVQEIQHEAI
jgi:hypothetical protein